MKSRAAQDDDFAFWRYEDLLARNIVGSRTDLQRKQEQLGFPRPLKFRSDPKSKALFEVAAVKAWVRQRQQMAETMRVKGQRFPSAAERERADLAESPK
jgi:hypothetical protein